MKVTQYRSDIDGLRAIAVGSVILFHAFPIHLKGGFVGVDVFFVISGFLISGIIFQSLEKGRFSYSDFYARRIKRIFPALAAVCAVSLFVGWYVLLPDEFQMLGKHIAAGAGFISNIVSWSEAGYFDAAADTKPLLHLWSLGVEEQFYILWPLALGVIWNRKVGFLTVTLLVAVVSFAINIAIVHSSPVAGFYLPFSRFWELMIGGILAYIVMHRSSVLERYANARSVAGFVMIAVGATAVTQESAFPGYWALLPALGTFLVISAGPDAWLNKYALSNRIMVAAGLISYSLYLWHWPLLVFPKIVVGRALSPLYRVEAVVAATALAILSYRFLEQPMRRGAAQVMPLALTVVMICIGLVGLLVYFGVAPSRLHTKNISKILAASHDWEYPPIASRNHGFGPLRYFVEDSNLGSYTLFLGDSNMEQYAPRIDRAIKDGPNNINGAIFVGNQSQCSLVSGILAGDKRCPDAIKELGNLIVRPSTRAVTIAVAWLAFKDQLIRPEEQSHLVQFLQTIAARKKVFLVMNIPTGTELAPSSMFAGSRITQIVPKPVSAIRFDFARFDAEFSEINRILADVAYKSGATLIDPINTLCPHQVCPVFDESGNPLYLDSGHLTRSYTVNSAKYIDATLDP